MIFIKREEFIYWTSLSRFFRFTVKKVNWSIIITIALKELRWAP